MSPLRLRQVSGDEGRVNDTLFQPAAARDAQGTETLVFFGGDVQDYPEVMAAHRDNRNYLKWNLESTARMLGINFPNKHILVVRPSRIEYKSFSCYDNFVSSNEAGVPEHTSRPRALPHLHREVDPLWWNESLALHEGTLSLVGFSKGCVVLNQVVYEFHYAQTLTQGYEYMTSSVARGVRELYWLDAGHAGAGGVWLTRRPLLETLAATGVQIYIHVSPYQVEDESRPWIGREEKIFTSSLKKLGAKSAIYFDYKVERYSHAAEGPPSLHTHFALLGSFKRLQDSAFAREH